LEAAIAAGQRVKLFYYLHSAKNYWAKDIIFLVTSHDEVGMQAWIDSYMGLHSPNTAAAPLPGRSGAIQAVINVEIPSSSLQYVNVIAGK